MPHPLNLSNAVNRERLYSMAGPAVRQEVYFVGTVDIGGSPTNVNFEVSDRIEGQISIGLQKPRIPNDAENGITGSQTTISIINTDGPFAVTQDGAIIDPREIGNAEIRVYADIGTAVPVEILRGRVVGPPRELRGKTIFTIRDVLYDAIRQPVLYEDFSTFVVFPFFIFHPQTTEVVDGLPLVQGYPVNRPHGGMCCYDGITTFDGNGRFLFSITNSNPDDISLKRIVFLNRAKPGKYVIQFQTAYAYTITYPDNRVATGSITTELITPLIVIHAVDWSGPGVAGAVIEFEVKFNAKGNPVTIMLNALEKALDSNQGNPPFLNPGVRIDIPAFERAEQFFESFSIFAAVGNDDNAVWERREKKPVNYLDFANRIASHIGCGIVQLPDGVITITVPWLDDTPIYDVTTDEAVGDFSIEPQDQFNAIRIQYGEYDGAYTDFQEVDLRADPANDEFLELLISAPFYKSGISDRQVQWLLETIQRRYYDQQVTIKATVSPQIGLTMLPGDVYRFVSEVQPRITTFVEARSVNKNIGRPASLELTPIQNREGPALIVGSGTIGNEKLH